MSGRSKKNLRKRATAPAGGKGNGVAAEDGKGGQDDLPEAGVKRAGCNWEVIGVCAALAAMVFAVFGQTLWDGFVNYDDDFNVYRTPEVIAGITVHGIAWAFKQSTVGDWIPLTTLSHMLDCQVYGLRAWGHHLSNVLLHTVAVILLFLALREMTGRIWRSGFVAAVFAIHPLRVESVAWVTERKDVLSGVFFMLTLLAYLSYTRRPESKLRYWRVAGLFVLGLLSKAMLVTLPFVLLLLDWWPLMRMDAGKGWRSVARLAVEKIPLICISAVFAVEQMAANKIAMPVWNIPVSERVANAAVSYATYLWQTVWPVDMAVLYPHPRGNISVWELTLALAVLGTVSAVVIVRRKVEPWLLMGWLWYLGMLVPAIGLVQTGDLARADRYTYLPMIGIYIAGTWAISELAGRWRPYRMVLAGGATVVVSVLMIVASLQAGYWSDSETLWNHTLAVTRNNYIAHYDRGIARLDQGRTQQAIADFQESLRIYPIYPEAKGNLGDVYLHEGRLKEAIDEFHDALRYKPHYPEAECNLGVALIGLGDRRGAIAATEKGLEMDPGNPKIENNLALFMATAPDMTPEEGAKALELATRSNESTDGADPSLLRTLAVAYAAVGEYARAVETAQRALQLAEEKSNADLAGMLTEEIQQYKAGRPHKEGR